MKNLLCIFIPAAMLSGAENLFAASYTWNGSNSTAWATSSNWTPNGVPGSGDNVTIVSGSNTAVYSTAGTAAVTNLTISSGTLDLNGYTLNVTGTATFNGGSISNGKINASGTTSTFAGTVFNCKLSAISANLFLNGSVFNDSTYVEQTGSTSNSGAGGNIYNAFTEIANSGTGSLRLSNASPYKPDTANADIRFTKKSSAEFWAFHQGSGHVFNGKVFINCISASGGIMQCGASATVYYNNDVELNNAAGTDIRFGLNSGANHRLASGKTISVGSGGFASGFLRMSRFTQEGNTKQTISLTGTSQLKLYSPMVFNAPVQLTTGRIDLNGVTFKDTARIEQTYGDGWSEGGNIFEGPATFINNNSLIGATFTQGVLYPDTFNNTLSLIVKGVTGSYITFGRNSAGTYFAKDVKVKNTVASGGIYLGNNSSSVSSCTFKAGAKLLVDTFNTGQLSFSGFKQLGDSAQNILLTGSAALLFYNKTVFNAPCYFEAPKIYLSGATLNKKSTFKKTGSGNDAGNGGMVFNDTVTLINSSSAGYFMLGYQYPDTFNSALFLKNSGSNTLYLNYNAAAVYNGDIYVSGAGTGTIYFGGNTGSAILASGKTIREASDELTAGTLLLRNFTKNGSAAINLDLGNAAMTFSTGSTINGNVTLTAGGVYLNGSVFNGNLDITKTGSVFSNSTGGNTFNGTFKILNTGSGQLLLNNSTSVSDVFNADAEFINEATGTGGSAGNIYVAYRGPSMQFNGSKTIFTNLSSVDRNIHVKDFGNCTFNSNIEVNNTSAGGTINFGNYEGTATLTSGKTITAGSTGFTSGGLVFRGFYQAGNTAQAITVGGSAALWFRKQINSPYSRPVFEGNVTVSSPRILLNGAVFNNAADFTVTGSSSSTGEGDNQFNGAFTFTNTGSGTAILANVTGDDFNGDVTFTKSGAGAIYPSYTGTSTYAGNITVLGGSSYIFGNATNKGMTVLDGSGSQRIAAGTGISLQFKKLKLNKPAETATAGGDISIGDSLIFVKGVLETAANVVLNDNAVATGASDSSYVDGAVKKVGNDAFTFPVGAPSGSPEGGGHYRPISISAPSSTSDAFTAEYFLQNSNDSYSHSAKDGSIAELSRNEYWNLARTTGTSNVSVTLSIDSATSCSVDNLSNLKVAAWDGTTWKDKGNGGTSGNVYVGTVVSNGMSNVFGVYGVGTSTSFECNPGSGCTDAFDIGNGDTCLTDVEMTSGEIWYKVVTDENTFKFVFDNLNNYEIDTLLVYSSCGGSSLASIYYDWDTLVFVEVYDVTINEDYYLKIKGSATGANPQSDFCFKSFTIAGGSDPCNLILNPSFEDGFIANNLNQMNFATNWYSGCTGNVCNGNLCTNDGMGNTPDIMDINSQGPNNGTSIQTYGPHQPFGTNEFRYASFGGTESFYGKFDTTLSCGMVYKLSMRLSTMNPINGFISTSAFKISLKNGVSSSINCTPSKLINTVNSYFDVNSWTLFTDTFSLNSIDASNNYNRIHFESFNPPLENSGTYLDSLILSVYQFYSGRDTTICLYDSVPLGYCDFPFHTGVFHWTAIPFDSSLVGQEHLYHPIVSPDTTTQYIVALYDSLNYCGVLSDTITVFVNQLPDSVYITTSDTIFCPGDSITLTAHGANEYIWSTGDTLSEITIALYDTTTISVIACNCPCAADTLSVTFYPLPPIVSDFSIEAFNRCINSTDSLHFTNLSANSNHYLWEFGDGDTSTAVNPAHIYTEPGYFQVILYAWKDSCGPEVSVEEIYILPACCSEPYDSLLNPDGFQDYDRLTDYHVTGSNEVWDSGSNPAPFNYMAATVYIEPGAKLTIDQKTLRFGPLGKIIVKNGNGTDNGGELVLLNAILTSIEPDCAVMWQGIEVWGNSDKSHATEDIDWQGKISVLAESYIKNAHTGIFAGRTTICFPNIYTPPYTYCRRSPYLLNYAGGKITIPQTGQFSAFEHNAADIRFLPYKYINSSEIKAMRFKGGTVLDPGYLSTNSYTYPNIHNPYYATANNLQRTTWGIYDWGVYLGNTIDQNNFDDMEEGIRSFDARYRVQSCTFTDMKYGIRIFNTNSSVSNGHAISGCVFRRIKGAANSAGVEVNAGRSDYIGTANKFGDVDLGLEDQSLFNIGISMNNSNAYKIEDNFITRIPTGIKAYGSNQFWSYIRYKNSTVGGNSFTRSSYNIIPIVNKRLTIKCNNHNNPEFVSGEYSGINWLVVLNLSNQGHWYAGANSPKLPAGNKFEPETPNTNRELLNTGILFNPIPFNYVSHSSPAIRQIHYTGITQNGPINHTFNTLPFPTNPDEACSPKIILGSITVFLGELNEKSLIIDSLWSEYETVKNNLDSGITEDLLFDISNPELSETTLKNNLVNASPLSDTVLIAMLYHRPEYADQFYKAVLLPNSPVSPKVRTEMDKILTEIAQTTADSILAAQVINTGVRTLKHFENEIEFHVSEKQEVLTGLVSRLVENDSLGHALQVMWETDSLDEGTVQAYISSLAYCDSISKAGGKLSDYLPEEEADSLWKVFTGILLDLQSDSLTWFEMDSAQEATVRAIAALCPAPLAGTNAQAVLQLVFGEETDSDPLCGSSGKWDGIPQTQQQEQNPQQAEPEKKLKLYPNPANQTLNIEYPLESEEKASIEVFGINGVRVSRTALNHGQQKTTLSTTHLGQGMYFITFTVNEELKQSEKIIIVHD